MVVVGAGQAGLSSAYFLRRAGLDFVVLDGESAPGGAWQHRWPTLTMATVHGIFDLPGLRFPIPDPGEPANAAVPAYFAAFERAYELPVRRPVRVSAVRDDGAGRLLVGTDRGEWSARALVNATGTWTRPFVPHYPGQETFRGRQLHTADYRGPAAFAGQRVLVVGGGTSAVQLLNELSPVAETTWVTRREPEFHEGEFTREYGRQVVAKVDARVRAGLPPSSVVSATGLPLTDAARSAYRRWRPMFERITPDGVVWADGATLAVDVILWCTGWRAALDHLAPLGLRSSGGGIAVVDTQAVADPRVFLVGYGPSASTVGANRAGRTAAAKIRALLDADRVPAVGAVGA